MDTSIRGLCIDRSLVQTVYKPEAPKVSGFLFYDSVWCSDNIRGLGPCVEGLIPSTETKKSS